VPPNFPAQTNCAKWTNPWRFPGKKNKKIKLLSLFRRQLGAIHEGFPLVVHFQCAFSFSQ
jgi:hypothetical protein